MAGIAGVAFVNIAAYILVFISQVSGVIVFVAVNATEGSEITRGMAFYTVVPFSFVFAAVNWEVHAIMVEGGGYPGIL